MKRNKLKIFAFLAMSSLCLTGCKLDLGVIKFGKDDEQEETPIEIDAYDWESDKEKKNEYYSTISSSISGESLLSALRNLNKTKRTSEVGYKVMGTDSGSPFRYTDFDPRTVKYNSVGVPYGTHVNSFYSGRASITFNREHVWPKSRGGDVVEDDILMVRPTIKEENEERGNSAYVTGMNSDSSGWDPVTAFDASLGTYKNIRGECARIIFYCMTASQNLILKDDASFSANGMGKLTDLIIWACENPVNEREIRRNVGSQYLQGNRNAFVDHPEYACKIWGNHNSQTKSACSKAGYKTN